MAPDVYKGGVEIVLSTQEAVCLVDSLQKAIKNTEPSEDIIPDTETKIYYTNELDDENYDNYETQI